MRRKMGVVDVMVFFLRKFLEEELRTMLYKNLMDLYLFISFLFFKSFGWNKSIGFNVRGAICQGRQSDPS